jgi:hypothetical protein
MNQNSLPGPGRARRLVMSTRDWKLVTEKLNFKSAYQKVRVV